MSPTPTEQCDVVVVGAGAIGLACAWRLAEAGLSVTVSERDEPGSGASGVAAGMLAPVNESHIGEQALVDLNLAAHERWDTFVPELATASGLDVPVARGGSLRVALDRDEAEELRRLHDFQRELGLDARWLAPSAARDREPGLSPRCAGAIEAPHEAAVDPGALTAVLAEAARRAGATVLSGSGVEELLVSGSLVCGVRLDGGVELAAGQVVVASGAWSGTAAWLPDDARPPVRPVKGEILTLAGDPGAPVSRGLVSTQRVYCVPRADGRLVVGATVEDAGFDLSVSAGGMHELLREAYRVLPDIAELAFVGARAGLRPGSPDNGPIVGPGSLHGLILATGHYRNGILLAPITADVVTALCVGDGEPEGPLAHFGVDRFAPAARP
ncbi:MAG: glycine oxidase ThiO [Solirubrobacterales bacterium]